MVISFSSPYIIATTFEWWEDAFLCVEQLKIKSAVKKKKVEHTKRLRSSDFI